MALVHRAVRGGGLVADTSFVCESAYVAGSATVGERSYVGHGAYISAGVHVGDDVIICDRRRIVADIPNGTDVLCVCCEEPTPPPPEPGVDPIFQETYFRNAVDPYNFTGHQVYMAPGSPDWNVGDPGFPAYFIAITPLPSLAALTSQTVRAVLKGNVTVSDWDESGDIYFRLYLHDGTELASGSIPTGFVGQTVLFDVELTAGILTINSGLYLTCQQSASASDAAFGMSATLTLYEVP